MHAPSPLSPGRRHRRAPGAYEQVHTSLAAVSGEFKAEYEAEVHRNAHLDWTVYAWEHLDLQNVASRSAALGLHLLKHLTLTLEYRDLVDTQICEWSPGPALAP